MWTERILQTNNCDKCCVKYCNKEPIECKFHCILENSVDCINCKYDNAIEGED